MKKLCLIIYTLSLFVTGCTHICKYSTLGELNNKIKDKEAKITLINELDLIGKDINIYTDSTFWLDPNTENKQSIITSEVNSITLKNRGRGALEGLGLGLLVGATTGALIGLRSGDGFFTKEQSMQIGGILLGGIGGLLGLSFGAILGSNDKFIIENKEKKISIFNVDLSSPLTPNSIIKLEVAPPQDILSIQKILEFELSSKGFDITEGYGNYTICFSYSINEQKKLNSFTATIHDMEKDKIVGVVNYRSNPYRNVIITEVELIKEFVNQLCPEMK